LDPPRHTTRASHEGGSLPFRTQRDIPSSIPHAFISFENIISLDVHRAKVRTQSDFSLDFVFH